MGAAKQWRYRQFERTVWLKDFLAISCKFQVARLMYRLLNWQGAMRSARRMWWGLSFTRAGQGVPPKIG